MDVVPSTPNFRDALPLGIAFSFAPHSATYAVFPADAGEALSVLQEFQPFFDNERIEKVGHDLKQQASLLRWHGMELRGTLMDVGLAHSMKEPELRHGISYLANLYLGYTPEPNPTSDRLPEWAWWARCCSASTMTPGCSNTLGFARVSPTRRVATLSNSSRPTGRTRWPDIHVVKVAQFQDVLVGVDGVSDRRVAYRLEHRLALIYNLRRRHFSSIHAGGLR